MATKYTEQIIEANELPFLIDVELIGFTYVPEYDCIYPRLSFSGDFLDHADFEALVSYCRKFYERFSPEDLEEIRKQKAEAKAAKRNIPVTTKPEKNKTPGYVYLIAGPEGIYKIGKAKTLTERITHLGVKLPFPITQVHSIKSNDYTEAEKYFHNYFAAKRGEGEWFALDQHDIEFFCSHENLDF